MSVGWSSNPASMMQVPPGRTVTVRFQAAWLSRSPGESEHVPLGTLRAFGTVTQFKIDADVVVFEDTSLPVRSGNFIE